MTDDTEIVDTIESTDTEADTSITEELPADDASDITEEPEDTEPTEGDEPEEEEASTDDELEINYGGNKYKFRKSDTVEEAAERLQAYAAEVQSDYTKKTQKVAEHSKYLDDRAKEFAIMAEARQEYVDHFADARSNSKYLDELRALDMPALWKEAPDTARRASDEIRRVEGVLSQLQGQMQTIERAGMEKLNEHYAKIEEDGEKYIKKHFPDFSEKDAEALIDFVQSYGIPKEEAVKYKRSPAIAVLARKAMLWDNAKAQAKKPPKVKQAEAPVKAIRGRGTAHALDPSSPEADRLSDEAWAAARNRQIMQKRLGR